MSEGSSLASRSRQLRYIAQSLVSVHPLIYMPIARRKYRRFDNRCVERDTDLVIEGFPRSGNTFAVVAFELAQGRQVKTAHHLHAAAQVISAVKMHIPTLVLIRDPGDSVVSFMIRQPHVRVRWVLTSWVRFHEHVLGCADRVVTAPFSDVTSNFGAVIREVNARFGTAFEEFEHTEANVARCVEVIERRHRDRYGATVETAIARPSAERESRKVSLRREFEAEELADLRERAYAVYRALVPVSNVP